MAQSLSNSMTCLSSRSICFLTNIHTTITQLGGDIKGGGDILVIKMVGRKIENLGKWEQIGRIKPALKELWYRGDLELLDKRPKLAMVGSRRMSSYGVLVIEKWMPELVANGVVIVSGFMKQFQIS